MREGVLLLVALGLVACRNKPAPIVAVDAGSPLASASASPAAAASLATRAPAPAPAPPLAIPVASDKLEPIALPRHAGSKLIWLKRVGDRMWLSATNLDAFSDGDGPMTKGADPFATLDYKPGLHALEVVGIYPRLFVLRTKRAAYRWESAEPAVFVRAADTGAWAKAKPLPFSIHPHAFAAYRDGALLVTSGIQYNARPGGGPDDGSKTTFVGPDGSVSEAKVAIPATFEAFAGDGDGRNTALLGVVATKAGNGSDDPGGYDFFGTHVVRFGKDGAARTAQLTTASWATALQYRISVKEHGGRAIVHPGGGMKEEIGWPNDTTVYVVDDSGRATAHEMRRGDGCRVRDADAVGDAIYAITECFGDDRGSVLVRKTAAKLETIALPAVAGGGCRPESIVVREPDDLWLTATCRNGPAIFRRGRAQEPLILP